MFGVTPDDVVTEATMRTVASAGSPSAGTRSKTMTRRAAACILQIRGVMRQRRQLGELSDYLLEDIGVTPAEARRESRRAFWDLPVTTFAWW